LLRQGKTITRHKLFNGWNQDFKFIRIWKLQEPF
jgi:hypothetical protein